MQNFTIQLINLVDSKYEQMIPDSIQPSDIDSSSQSDLICSVMECNSTENAKLLFKKIINLPSIQSLFLIGESVWATHRRSFIDVAREIPLTSIKFKEYHACIGYGRVLRNICGITIRQVIGSIQDLLQISEVRVAFGCKHNADSYVSEIAVCPGAGGSVLSSLLNPDVTLDRNGVFITGELSHHDILNAVHNGYSLVMCEHSNTERLYLRDCLMPTLNLMMDSGHYASGLEVVMSKEDRDPVQYFSAFK